MPYTPTVFVDVPDPAFPPSGAVPVDAAELNKIGAGVQTAQATAEAAQNWAAIMPAGLIGARPASNATGSPPLYVSTDEPGGPRVYQNAGASWRLLFVNGPEIDVTTLGAKCDGVISVDANFTAIGSMTSGSADVTGVTYNSGMLGKPAIVRGAGPAGATLVTTVTGNNGTKPTLAAAASTTIGGTHVYIGSDDTTAYAAANVLSAAGFGRRRILLGGGCSMSTVTIGPGDVYGRAQKASILIAGSSYGPVVQFGNPTLVTPSQKGDGIGHFTVLGMGLATGLVHTGSSVNSQIRNIDGQYSAPGGYGLRVELAQNHEFSLIQMTNIGGNCLEVDSAAGGHAFYKCEWNNCGVGTNGNAYYNATIRQSTSTSIGGYKNPTDISFHDNIFERGSALGRGGSLYVGNGAIRLLFDACNLAIGGDITATNPGVVRAAITITYENHDSLTGNGSSQTGGLEFRGCHAQGQRGKIELNTNSPTDGWRVRDQSWTVDVDIATGGTFTLTDQNSAQTTGALAWNISPAAFQTALEGLGVIGAGNVSVTQSGTVYTITLKGTLTYVDPTAAGIKLVGSGAGLTPPVTVPPSTVNFAVGVLNSASPTIAILVNGGGNQIDFTLDGGRFFNHAAVFAVDDDCTVNLKQMPATYAYGDLFLNPPQRTTNLAGQVLTRGSPNTLTFDQVFQARSVMVPAFRTPGIHNNNSAVGLSGIRPALPGMLRKDGDRLYILNDDSVTWTPQALLSDAAPRYSTRASGWVTASCPATTRAIVLSGASSTQINAGQVYGIPIDLAAAGGAFVGLSLITTIAAVLSAPADATHYCRARLALFTDAAGLPGTYIPGTQITVDMTPTAGARPISFGAAANPSATARVWALTVFEGQGVTTWPTVTSSNLGIGSISFSNANPPTSALPTAGGLKEASAINPNGSGAFDFSTYNAAGLVAQGIGSAPLIAVALQ